MKKDEFIGGLILFVIACVIGALTGLYQGV